MIIVRTTVLPSKWAKTDRIAGKKENNTEYTKNGKAHHKDRVLESLSITLSSLP